MGAEITGKPDCPKTRRQGAYLFNDLPAAINTAIVDEEDAIIAILPREQSAADSLIVGLQVLRLVVHRRYRRYDRLGFHASSILKCDSTARSEPDVIFLKI